MVVQQFFIDRTKTEQLLLLVFLVANSLKKVVSLHRLA
jgi:hypothetical protein